MKDYQLNLQLMTNNELMREYESVESLAHFVKDPRYNAKWRGYTDKCEAEMRNRGIKSVN